MADEFDWVEKEEERMKDERGSDYFNIEEGKNQFVLLSHFHPLRQVFDPGTKKYRVAVEGDKNISIKGVCWVWQDGAVKQAKMPYVVVKAVRALRDDPDWDFKFPFPHVLTLNAVGAGTKEVKYSLTPSPKQVAIPQEVLDELAKKPTPEQIVEKIKEGKVSQRNDVDTSEQPNDGYEYPTEEINPEDIPFGD